MKVLTGCFKRWRRKPLRGPLTNPKTECEEVQPCNFVRCTTGSSYAELMRTSARPAASLFPTRLRRSRSKARSSLRGPVPAMRQGAIQPLDVKAGDRVLFGKWSGTEVKIDGEELLIMKESDILGVLEGAAASKKKAA